MLHKASARKQSSIEQYGFDKIETLELPQQSKAREILTSLATNPGVLACMKKHRWKVGSLAELFPDGKVGESPVTVMGLNTNKGQQILLRLRTDDCKGFRKISSIRSVLYHELAHNVYSQHDGDFFQLMRQIERECTELDWTRGSGLTTTTEPARSYTGGTFRLGGNEALAASSSNATVQELAAWAALMRMTAEEEEIQQNCGCGRENLQKSARAKSDQKRDDE
jgi:WLM domain